MRAVREYAVEVYCTGAVNGLTPVFAAHMSLAIGSWDGLACLRHACLGQCPGPLRRERVEQ